jgi:DNA-binding response OmpR family regulator
MRSPQVLIYDKDNRLSGWLREQLQDRKWTWREVRSPESCLRLLRHGGPNVVLLKLGEDLPAEMSLLDQLGRLYPETGTVLVSDLDNPWLTSLAWDLGARYVLSPPQPREQLAEIVAGLMSAASPGHRGVGGSPSPGTIKPTPPREQDQSAPNP